MKSGAQALLAESMSAMSAGEVLQIIVFRALMLDMGNARIFKSTGE
jgi:hypothetical protein